MLLSLSFPPPLGGDQSKLPTHANHARLSSGGRLGLSQTRKAGKGWRRLAKPQHPRVKYIRDLRTESSLIYCFGILLRPLVHRKHQEDIARHSRKRPIARIDVDHSVIHCRPARAQRTPASGYAVYRCEVLQGVKIPQNLPVERRVRPHMSVHRPGKHDPRNRRRRRNLRLAASGLPKHAGFGIATGKLKWTTPATSKSLRKDVLRTKPIGAFAHDRRDSYNAARNNLALSAASSARTFSFDCRSTRTSNSTYGIRFTLSSPNSFSIREIAD